jgi:ADP-heptose:LPS heptosyltransferase
MSDRRRRVERALRRAVFGTLVGRQRTRVVDPSAVDLTTVRKVLLVRLNNRLGNLLLVTPVLAAVRGALPGAQVDLLCLDRYADLLAGSPDLDRTITLRLRWRLPVVTVLRLARQLRRERYDLVIDCARGSSFLAAVCSAFSGARFRVAHAGARYGSAFNVHVHKQTDYEHKVELVLDLLQGLGIPAVTREVMLTLSETDRAGARASWRRLGLPEASPVVGVHVGGRGRKRWPLQRFLDLVHSVTAELRVPVLLFAGPEERQHIDRVRDRIPAAAIVAPALGARDFGAFVARCAVFVCGDSGPMHLAAAVGVPTVAIFSTRQSRHYRPRGPRHVSLFDERGVAPEQVVAAVAKVLADAASPAVGTDGDPRATPPPARPPAV